ncbi:hypothetical protein BJ085DRAFT_42825 [Dimargaris cristalligena]|uniref:histone deacetylase n=1 Tax=Dimargaris cristalligena TaxID=215637 RepID=A0A4P9ZYT1_9FUNG|nr:hypothetical protein BJ085DRAFT_42825 [Dimargaris cristalligena]|eukprot:RKP38915.1 hypothetical protein BJ085DRAFT_42825 [Dimargaris cristalligena]
MASEPKKRVAYFYDLDVGNYHYGAGHPMKPHRIRMTHSLVMNYGLYKDLSIFRATPANKVEMTQFHTDEYIDFLHRVTPETLQQYTREQSKFNVGDDCPVFDGLFEYCSLSAGGSMEGAGRLNRGLSDICINWAGGLHHAKKSEASGFCYVNDIVLAILELLRYFPRVLYIDIDVHHGDGVEEAFYTTDRVMTCSFHKYGEFFPGTGELRDIGVGKGKYYAVNFPLRSGIDDDTYQSVFEPVIQHVMEWYRPSAVVLQCGTDSLAGDKLGSFNLSMKGHARCVEYIKKLNIPTLLLGGGGYTIRNVSRAWTYETGVAVGKHLGPELPLNDYIEYFGPEYTLDVPSNNATNYNSREYLDKIKRQVLEHLSHTRVQMQPVPPDHPSASDDRPDEDDVSKDERLPRHELDARIVPENEYYDDADDLKDPTGQKRVPIWNGRPVEQEYREESSVALEEVGEAAGSSTQPLASNAIPTPPTQVTATATATDPMDTDSQREAKEDDQNATQSTTTDQPAPSATTPAEEESRPNAPSPPSVGEAAGLNPVQSTSSSTTAQPMNVDHPAPSTTTATTTTTTTTTATNPSNASSESVPDPSSGQSSAMDMDQ